MRSEIEPVVLEVLGDVLGTTAQELRAQPVLDLHQWDSMAALEALSQLESRFGITVDLRLYHEARQVADLVGIVGRALDSRTPTGEASDGTGGGPGRYAAEGQRPRWSWRGPAGGPRPTDLRVAVLASYTVDPLVPRLGTALEDAGVRADVWAGPYNQIERQCLDAGSATARFGPQVVVAAPRLEELWAGRRLPLGDPPEGYGADLLYLADACVGAAGRWRAELIFVLPAVPEARPAGLGDDGNPLGVLATATRVREAARRQLAGREGVAVLDAEALLRTIGSQNAYRPGLFASARIPFSDGYFDLLGQRIGRLIALCRHPAPPLIVLDAACLAVDGDLVRGDPLTSLEPYLAEVGRLGASIALCDATEDSRARLAAAVPVACWRGAGATCSQQIREMAAGSSTEFDRVAFLSVRGSAIEGVAHDLPEVATLHLPPDPTSWAHALNGSRIVDQRPPASVDPISVNHTAAAGSAVPVSLEGFLERLRLTVGCTAAPVDFGEAAADLTRRVSEFHLNGEVWAAERFTDHIQGATHECWVVDARDRFGDHGHCGVVVTHPDGDTLSVDLWVLTCPVLGKGVENRVLRRLVEQARVQRCATVTFRYHPTPRNHAIRSFLSGLVPAPATPPADRPAMITIPVVDLERPAAPGRPGPVDAGAAGPDVGATGHHLRPRRRTAAGSSDTGRFTTASQILRAVTSSGRQPDHRTDGDEGAPPRTETERILAGLFGAVLGRPTVGVDRNFFASGDSMLAVQLIAKANQAGLRLTLRQVFAHQTVAALAAVATPTARPGGIAEPVRSAPALPLQAWFFGRHLPSPNHFNQSQRYEVPSDVDIAALERAVAALAEHHQALRMRFVDTGTGWRQVDPGPPETAPFTHVDLRRTRPEEWEAVLTTHESRLQVAMSPTDGKLIHVALFTFGPQRPPHLLVILHHLAIDGISWRIVLEDIQDAYRQACAGTRVRLTPVGTSVLSWAEELSDYANSGRARAELSAWTAGPRASVRPLPVDVPGAGGGVFTDFAHTLFSSTETRALRERAVGTDRVSLDVLLLAAATRVLAGWTGWSRFLIDVVNHGREPFIDGVDLSRTVGWLVMNVPVLFEIDAEQPLGDLVPTINRQIRTWSSHHGAGDSLLRFLSRDESVRAGLAALPSADVLFSYAGHFDGPGAAEQEHPLLGRPVDAHTPDMAPDGGTPYGLQFDTMISDGRIGLTICYRHTQYHKSTAETLLEEWASQLRELVGHPQARPIRDR